MKVQKTLLLTRVANLKHETLLKFANLPYTKICLLYNGKRELEKIKVPSKIEIVEYTTLTSIHTQINNTYKKYLEYMIIPNFSGDDFSKYAIKSYNKTFGTKIDPKAFKEKDVMMKFV